MDVARPRDVTRVRPLAVIAAGLLAVALFSGCGEEPQARIEDSAPARAVVEPAEPADPWAVTPTQPLYQPTPVTLAVADPIRVDIGAIGVSSDLLTLGFQDDGSMEVPKDYDRAGWFAGGPRPGENGPSVIVGHVDSESGPAVFERLGDLKAGDVVDVTRSDGSIAQFAVTHTATYEKAAFPTEAVFGPTPESELRLVTCGGEFDFDRRSYKSNVVVYTKAVIA